MNETEQQLLQHEAGHEAAHLTLRTATTIDVGLWWRRKPLWLCLTTTRLVVLAAGRRQYSESIPLTHCRESFYNPTSGELVIAPDSPLRFPRLRMPASTALKVIDLIQSPPSTPNTPSP